MFGRSKRLNRRLKEVRRELSRIDGDIRTLSSRVENPTDPAPPPRLRSKAAAADKVRDPSWYAESVRRDAEMEQEQLLADSPARAPNRSPGTESNGAEAGENGAGKPMRPRSDPRLANTLGLGYRPVQPLREERRVQRNKAIAMLIIALIVLFWLIYRLFVM